MQIATAEQAIDQVTRLAKKLDEQAKDALKWREYYEGKQPLKFSSAEWRKWFGAQYEDFSDNWCAPVVDATAERQRLLGFIPYEADQVDRDLSRIMRVNGADVDFGLAATEAQYARRAFTSVWGNPDDPSTPFVSYESPTEVVVKYAPGTRREPIAALKRWTDEDSGTIYATLYTPHHLWKFKAVGPIKGLVLPASLMGQWAPREGVDDVWPLPNPMGRVPISELPNRTSLSGGPMSTIAGVASMQDAINLLWGHLFTASDFAAMPQRVVLGAQLPKIPILNENGEQIGEKVIDLDEANVRRIINFEGKDTKIDSWPAAEPKRFLEVIQAAKSHVQDQTRTPAYYFSSSGSISNISGDTVTALDAGLVKKVKGVNEVQSDGTRRTGEMMCLAQGDHAKAAAMAAGTVKMGDEEIRSEAQLADALMKYKEIGFPFEWIAKQKIDDPEELAEVLEAYERERRDPDLDDAIRTLNRTREADALEG